MKFISKSNNLRIVLKHGISAEPISGRAAVNGLYVKFENGLANIENEEMVKLMFKHPGYNSDFICAKDEEGVFSGQRRNAEPRHDIVEITAGGVIGKNLGEKNTVALNNEQKELLTKMAKEMATEMLKKLVSKTQNKEEKIDSENKTEKEKEDKETKKETPLEKARRVKAEKRLAKNK